MPYHLERCVYDIEPYVEAVVEAKRRGHPVKLGIEVDYEPGREEETAEALDPYPWDYVLGSIHFLDGLGIDAEPSLVDSVGAEQAWSRYYETLSSAARSGLFDSLAHPDLVKFHGDEVDWDWEGVARSLDGVAIEVSSAGLHKPHGKLYPSPAFLAAARAAGRADHAGFRRAHPGERRQRSRSGRRPRPRRRLRDGHRLRSSEVAPGAPGMSDLRIGLGIDAHRFAEGIPLVLAGVDFPGEPGLAGHSDGDVVAHALIDAILGAAGKGDIGELFPSADPQWLDASSIRLLQRSYEVVRIGGFELVNADCVLIGERPRIADVRVAMGARLAGAMGVDIDRVTVRATTTDELGFTGRGEGLAAQAVALLKRSA